MIGKSIVGFFKNPKILELVRNERVANVSVTADEKGCHIVAYREDGSLFEALDFMKDYPYAVCKAKIHKELIEAKASEEIISRFVAEEYEKVPYESARQRLLDTLYTDFLPQIDCLSVDVQKRIATVKLPQVPTLQELVNSVITPPSARPQAPAMEMPAAQQMQSSAEQPVYSAAPQASLQEATAPAQAPQAPIQQPTYNAPQPQVQQAPQQTYAMPQAQPEKTKKKKKGALIGIVAGVLAFIVAFAVGFFAFGGFDLFAGEPTGDLNGELSDIAGEIEESIDEGPAVEDQEPEEVPAEPELPSSPYEFNLESGDNPYLYVEDGQYNVRVEALFWENSGVSISDIEPAMEEMGIGVTEENGDIIFHIPENMFAAYEEFITMVFDVVIEQTELARLEMFPVVQAIEFSPQFTHVTLRVDTSADWNADADAAAGYTATIGALHQMFYGVPSDMTLVTVTFINADTADVLSTIEIQNPFSMLQ